MTLPTVWRSVLSDMMLTITIRILVRLSLNAPCGARCFLTSARYLSHVASVERLNAPFGARCFLTIEFRFSKIAVARRLNAPFGARCFLTVNDNTQSVTVVLPTS